MRLPKPLILGIQIAEEGIQRLANAEQVRNSILDIAAAEIIQPFEHIGHMRCVSRAESQQRNGGAFFQPPVFQ